MYIFQSAAFSSLVLPLVVLAEWPVEHAGFRRTTLGRHEHLFKRQLQSFPAITLTQFSNEVSQLCATPDSSLASSAVKEVLKDIGTDTMTLQNSLNGVAQQLVPAINTFTVLPTVPTRWSLIAQEWAAMLGVSSNIATNIANNIQQFTSVQLPDIISLANGTQTLAAVAILETFTATLTTLTQQAGTAFDNFVSIQGQIGSIPNLANSTGTQVYSSIAIVESYFYYYLVIWGAVLNDNQANIDALSDITSGAVAPDDIWSLIAGVACVCEVASPALQTYASLTMSALL